MKIIHPILYITLVNTVTPELRAWAGGFFEGEGCISGSYVTRGKTERVFYPTLSLNNTDFPLVRRFHKALLREGTIKGPYFRSYYKPQLLVSVVGIARIENISRFLWPYLGNRRKSRIREIWKLTKQCEWEDCKEDLILYETAWATGLFDAEGSVVVLLRKTGNVSIRLSLSNTDSDTIQRFYKAVNYLGTIYETKSNSSNCLDVFTWVCSREEDVYTIMRDFRPYFSSIKRKQYDTAASARLKYKDNKKNGECS